MSKVIFNAMGFEDLVNIKKLLKTIIMKKYVLILITILFYSYSLHSKQCSYLLDLKDSNSYSSFLMNANGSIHISSNHWKVMGDNSGPALGCLEPKLDFENCSNEKNVTVELYINRTGFVLSHDYVKIRYTDSILASWQDLIVFDAATINGSPSNISNHYAEIPNSYILDRSSLRIQIIVHSSKNGSPIMIKNTGVIINNEPLPLELTSFQGISERQSVQLNWSTANEENVKQFDIERMNDFDEWNWIGSVRYTDSNNKYSFTDRNPSQGSNYYRLAVIDFDNSYFYSNIVEARVTHSDFVSVYPTKVSEALTVVLNNSNCKNCFLTIHNRKGQKLKELNNITTNTTIDVSTLMNGVYYLNIWKDRQFVSKPFIVVRD